VHSLLSLQVFRLWLVVRGLTNVGSQVQLASLGWAVYAATEDPLALAWLGLAQFLPVLLLALPAGALVDRQDRRLILGLAATGQGLVSATAAALVALGHVSDLTAMGLGLAMGTLRAFSGPASQALLPALVPIEVLPRALAAGSVVFQLATIVGPSLAGLLIGAGAGATGALVVASALQLAAALATTGLPRIAVAREAAGWEDLLAGLRYVRDTPILLACISLDLFAVLLGGATALMPAFATDVLEVGPEGFGALRAAPALGAATTALVLARWPIQRQAGPRMLIAVALFGLVTVIFGLSRSFPLSLAALVALGAVDMVSVVVRQTVVQLRTPDAVRGRVSAVNLVFIGASNELGEFESGVAARLFGLVPAVVGGGLATMGVVALWAWRFPELRKTDRL
jgi:MFS family permease